MGESESISGTISKRTPASAKITIALQTIIILFLGYWAFEEYQNNIYFQSYVNATLQVYMLPIAAIVFGVPALAIFGFFVKRSRAHSSETLRFENGGSGSMSSFGVSRASSRGKSEKVSPLYAELSSRFGQSITTSNPIASQTDQEKRPVLQQADQSSASRIKTGPSGLPVLERVESRQQTLQTKGETQNQGYQPPRAIGDSPLSPQ